MAIGSGLGSSAGFVNESTYGTYVAPTKFARVKSATANKSSTRVQGEGIQNGIHGMLLSQFVETVTGGTGQLAFDVQSKNMGLLLQTLMGTSVTPVQQAATTAYLQTHTLADTYGKSLTVQLGLPNRAGTVTPATLKGVKVTQAAFSCAVDGILGATFDLDAFAYENSTALATPSYTASVNAFHGAQMSVKVGTYGSEAAIVGVKSVACTIARPHDASGYYAGATVAGTKSEPVLNGATTISGTLDADFVTLADLHSRARDNSNTSLVIEFVGPLIASTYYETFRITIPNIVFTSPEGFNIAGRDKLQQSFGYEWRYDGTNQPKIEVISAEVAL
jgi:hypothetical protein